MFINKLNQLYKPERILYYKEVSDEEIEAFYAGARESEVCKYVYNFGVYDYPGIFYIKDLPRPVLGIEFRLDDDRIEYPKNLKSIILDESFFASMEVDTDFDFTDDSIHMIFDGLFDENDGRRIYSWLGIVDEPDVMAAFVNDKKVILMHQFNVVKDNAQAIINDDKEDIDRDELYNKAFIDPITNHYNWNHLVPFLEMPNDYGIKDYAFIHFDIKEFKVLNEVYGHAAANETLERVVAALNESEYVYTSARCHNDNFAAIIKDMPPEDTYNFLESMFEKLSYFPENYNYKIYYRCGVVPMQRAMLLGNRVADAGKLAQSLGKSLGKTDITFYTDSMHDDILWSNHIKAYVDSAIANDEFLVYLQPKFDINTEKIKGAEALIRWNYKNQEILPPSKFVPFFEKDGSIDKIDDIVLHKVCQALKKWKEEGKPLYPISVNISRNQFYNGNLINHLTEIVDNYDVDHKLIDFELTESATYDNKLHMINVLNGLRDRDFQISMDDFGTGYSSLSLLTDMPLDTLKIDKSFVDYVGTNLESDKNVTVIKHIIALAKELNFTCLAEGAEEKTQVEKLKELGCEVIQGYYYSKPIPIEEYEKIYL